MKSDLSRGFQPDRKRGKSYRRVLLQQGRLLLDSDVASLVDAVDGQMRDLGRAATCLAGSPDLGFLVTPGRLFKLFTGPEDVPGAVGVDVWLDYGRRHLGRLPSLRIGAESATGHVTIPLRPLTDAESENPPAKLRLWVRADANHNLILSMPNPDWANAKTWTKPVVAGQDWQAVDIDNVPASLGAIRITYSAASSQHQLWIGRIESFEASGTSSRAFWAAAGHFHLDGMQLALMADAAYPGLTYGMGAPPALAAGAASASAEQAGYVAYLEAWERSITAVEDPGILEHALGSAVDTCTRTVNVGQVKLLALSPALDINAIRAAFADIDRGGGLLTVSPIPTTTSSDPCQIPEGTSYLGEDNRLYYFEVHQPGDLTDVVVKWSRNSGADLVAVAGVDAASKSMTFPPDVKLEEADIVEVLVETEAVSDDLLDAQAASITAGRFVPPVRKVGQLFYLAGKSASATSVQFTLKPRRTGDPEASLNSNVLYKVRRWDGVIDPDEIENGSVDIEDGIRVAFGTVGMSNQITQLGSDYRAGDYWIYEARAVTPNSNGAWQATPHGPERLFTPLAGLDPGANATQPLVLKFWLDDRYARLCELTADDIAFDGLPTDSSETTVQEVIETLLRREQECCCDIIIDAAVTQGAATAHIAEAIASLPAEGGSICLRGGMFTLDSTLFIDRPVELHGCPEAVLVQGPQLGIFVHSGGRLKLKDITLFSQQPGGPMLTLADNTLVSLEAEGCGFIHVGDGSNPLQLAIRVGDNLGIENFNYPPAQVPGFDVRNLQPGSNPRPSIEMRECIVIGDRGIHANVLSSLVIKDSIFYCRKSGICAEEVRSGELRGSGFHTGLDPAAVANWQAVTLASQVRALLEERDNEPAAAGGIGYAVFVRTLFGTTIAECVLVGRYGITALACLHSGFASNLHATVMHGLRLDNSAWNYIDGERITATGVSNSDGFVAGGSGVMAAFHAYDLRIADCQINAQFGVVLGEDQPVPWGVENPEDTVVRELKNVRVSDNQIYAARIGVLISRHTSPNPWWEFFVNGVNVANNEIDGAGSGHGIIARAWSFWEYDEEIGEYEEDPRLRIAGNHIYNMARGLFLQASFAQIADNYISVEFDSDVSAVQLDGCSECTFQGNFVQWKNSLSTAGGHDTSEIPLVQVKDSYETRVIGNTIRTPYWRPDALHLLNNSFLHICENNISNRLRCIQPSALVLSGNYMGDLWIEGYGSATIRNNRCYNVNLVSISGQWQINSNRFSNVQIVPYTYSTFSVATAWPADIAWAAKLDTVTGVSSARIIELMEMRDDASLAAPRERTSARSSTARPATRRAMDASRLISEPEQAMAEWTKGAVEYVVAGWREAISESMSQVSAGMNLATLITQEYYYELQLTGNWMYTLDIGSLAGSASPYTVVQAVGNHVEYQMKIKSYQKMVIANNVAGSYQITGMPTPGTGPQYSTNLDK